MMRSHSLRPSVLRTKPGPCGEPVVAQRERELARRRSRRCGSRSLRPCGREGQVGGIGADPQGVRRDEVGWHAAPARPPDGSAAQRRAQGRMHAGPRPRPSFPSRIGSHRLRRSMPFRTHRRALAAEAGLFRIDRRLRLVFPLGGSDRGRARRPSEPSDRRRDRRDSTRRCCSSRTTASRSGCR